jgi:DNA-binding XRE family transcriptional regulator
MGTHDPVAPPWPEIWTPGSSAWTWTVASIVRQNATDVACRILSDTTIILKQDLKCCDATPIYRCMSNTTTPKTFGAVLRELRESLGLSITAAAARAGLSAQVIMHVESDSALCSTAFQYCRGLGRRPHIQVQRDRKQRAVDLASASGLALETTYRCLALISDPSRAIGESDVQLQSLYALLAAMDGSVHSLRVR